MIVKSIEIKPGVSVEVTLREETVDGNKDVQVTIPEELITDSITQITQVAESLV